MAGCTSLERPKNNQPPQSNWSMGVCQFLYILFIYVASCCYDMKFIVLWPSRWPCRPVGGIDSETVASPMKLLASFSSAVRQTQTTWAFMGESISSLSHPSKLHGRSKLQSFLKEAASVREMREIFFSASSQVHHYHTGGGGSGLSIEPEGRKAALSYGQPHKEF